MPREEDDSTTTTRGINTGDRITSEEHSVLFSRVRSSTACSTQYVRTQETVIVSRILPVRKKNPNQMLIWGGMDIKVAKIRFLHRIFLLKPNSDQ
mgnify:CR=1 FL=1